MDLWRARSAEVHFGVWRRLLVIDASFSCFSWAAPGKRKWDRRFWGLRPFLQRPPQCARPIGSNRTPSDGQLSDLFQSQFHRHAKLLHLVASQAMAFNANVPIIP